MCLKFADKLMRTKKRRFSTADQREGRALSRPYSLWDATEDVPPKRRSLLLVAGEHSYLGSTLVVGLR